VTDEDMEEYKKTEIIRKSIADVKKRAKEADFIRKSPDKVYAKVKSRIACNMKSQKKAKKTAKKIAQNIEAVSAAKRGESPQKSFHTSFSPSPKKKRMQSA